MSINSLMPTTTTASLASAGSPGSRTWAVQQQEAIELQAGKNQNDSEVREQFQQIMGELLFGQMLKSMRKTVGEAAYFNGGRAEEIFTEQLDQQIAGSMSKTMGDQFVGPMFDLTMMGRK